MLLPMVRMTVRMTVFALIASPTPRENLPYPARH